MLPRKSAQSGSAQTVVLIVTIMVLFAFVIMWFMAKDDMTKAQQERDAAKLEQEAARKAVNAAVEAITEQSRRTGWATVALADRIPAGTTPQEVQVAEKAKAYLAGTVTDVAALDANRTPDGTTAGPTPGPGFLNALRAESFIEMEAAVRTGKSEAVDEKKADLGWMTPEFKQKLAEVHGLWEALPPVPAVQGDPDDVAAKTEYEEKMREYEAALKRYNEGVEQLQAMEPYRRFEQVVRKSPGWTLTEANEVKRLDFFKEPAVGEVTFEEMLKYPLAVIRGLKDEFVKQKKADVERINQVTTEKDALEASLAQVRTELEAEQQRHTSDSANLTAQLEEANRKVEANRLEATNLQNRVQVLEEEGKRTVAGLTREKTALEERVRLDKQVRDLAIRRNDPDGTVLSANSGMQTVVVNLGSADKVFPGLKFEVTQTGRGGLRESKGEIMVVRVTGPHSATASIRSEARTIAPGDSIHNPFYSPTETIHVWFARPIERLPKAIAEQRLASMGVVIDAALTGETDYVVVPDSMVAPTEPATGGEEGADAPAPGTSELEKLQSRARTLGAQVITEEMLFRFLDVT